MNPKMFFVLLLAFLDMTQGHQSGLDSLDSPISHQVMPSNDFCPLPASIYPCTCLAIYDLMLGFRIHQVKCEGPNVNQEVIDHTMETIRSFNNKNSSELYIGSLSIRSTSMITLNVSSLMHTEIPVLTITANEGLESVIVDPEAGNSKIETLHLSFNGLTDDRLMSGYSSFIEAFGVTTKILDLSSNTGITELALPGLHKMFPRLTSIYLEGTGIRSIGGGQFSNHHGFYLNLNNNGLTELGADAFKFDEFYQYNRIILLEDNELTDEGIHETAFLNVNSPAHIHLTNNKFQFISAQKFYSFLNQTYETNAIEGTLTFTGCPFVCDQRMSWLKDEKERFQERVIGVFCTNDEGSTIFNTTLV